MHRLFLISSGLAVQPNPDMEGGAAAAGPGGLFGAIRSRAVDASSAGAGPDSAGAGAIRRRITMYRDGFTVDDGPFRRLDDPANGEFLRSLAAGRTPKEMGLDKDGNAIQGDVMVGLVDKRGEDYGGGEGGGGGSGGGGFAAFEGEGTSLGSSGTPAAEGGVITPDGTATAPAVDESQPTTSIQVRLANGKRLIVKVNQTATVGDVAAAVNASGDAGDGPYTLNAGFPPRPVEDLTQTVVEAGLAGSVVNQKKAA